MTDSPNHRELQTARTMADRIVAAAEGRVERVILFGSRARGTAHERSDYDLLVVESEPQPSYPEEERLTDALGDLGIWADVRVVSREGFERTRKVVGFLSYAAAREGITLFIRGEDDRRHSAVA